MITFTDLDIAAKTVWGEARGEGELGMLAVACVIVNRANKKDAQLASVCLKPFQFSAWNKDDPNKPAMETLTPDDKLYRKALCCVLRAIDEAGTAADPTLGADHYHTLSVRPYWADKLQETATIYSHRFYKES